MDNLRLEKTIIGNLILDADLDESLISEKDFEFSELAALYKGVKQLKVSGQPPENLILQPGVRLELFDECTNVGIITTNYHHNVKLIKKAAAARQIKDIGAKLQMIQVSKVNEMIREAKDALNLIENDISDEDMKVWDPDVKPYEPKGASKGYVPTGFETIDKALDDLAPRLVTLITGRSFEGKSTLTRQIIANAINAGNKVFWVIGESHTQSEMERLYEIVIGRDDKLYQLHSDNKRVKKVPKPEVRKALAKWHEKKLRILHKAEAKLKTTDELFQVIEKHALNWRPQLIVIDNLMSVLSASAVEKLEKQGEFMQKCCDISRLHNLHIILVVHPNKGYQKGKRMDYEFVSGSSDLTNKADNVLVVRKNHDKVDGAQGVNDGWIDVEKNRIWGTLTNVMTYYDNTNRSLAEIDPESKRIKLQRFDISKLFDVNLKFWNGSEQTIESGTGWRKEE